MTEFTPRSRSGEPSRMNWEKGCMGYASFGWTAWAPKQSGSWEQYRQQPALNEGQTNHRGRALLTADEGRGFYPISLHHPCTMVQNSRILGHQKSHFPTSSGASEWASERTSERCEARKRSEQCGASKRVIGASEWASGWAGGPLLTSSLQDLLNHCAMRAPCHVDSI